jgi:hypothetical protein
MYVETKIIYSIMNETSNLRDLGIDGSIGLQIYNLT